MKVSYQKKFDYQGFLYNQTVTFSKDEISIASINESIENELEHNAILNNRCFLKPILKGVNYTTLTQKNFVENLLNLKLKDRNTIFIFN